MEQFSTSSSESSDSSSEYSLEFYMDTSWVLDAANLVFFMQAGFGMLEAGMVRAKNTKSILLKNLINTAICAISYYCVGHSFAYGKVNPNSFVGFGNFFLMDYTHYAYWMIQWAYAATATTIATGAMAERLQLHCYILFTLVQTILIYPFVAHWIWSQNGWLFDLGIVDFAGGAVIHIVAGITGACGSFLLGPRIGRFNQESGKPKNLPGHSVVLMSLGAMILWYSWYGYTAGASLGMTRSRVLPASRVSVVVTLSGATGLITVLGIGKIVNGHYDLVKGINGLIAGLVSSTSSCAYIEPWAAIIIGFVGGIVYWFSSWALLNWLRLDDPVDSTAIHLFGGCWSLISVAFFATHGRVRNPDIILPGGIFYGGGISLLWVQLVGMVLAILWAGFLSGIFFFTMDYFGKLRVDVDTELAGLDNSNHGGSAYIFD
ncbi:hypothetical protein ACTFIV_001312 [Dictyostelium citrinum]